VPDWTECSWHLCSAHSLATIMACLTCSQLKQQRTFAPHTTYICIHSLFAQCRVWNWASSNEKCRRPDLHRQPR
jgi:hypothetical protein